TIEKLLGGHAFQLLTVGVQELSRAAKLRDVLDLLYPGAREVPGAREAVLATGDRARAVARFGRPRSTLGRVARALALRLLSGLDRRGEDLFALAAPSRTLIAAPLHALAGRDREEESQRAEEKRLHRRPTLPQRSLMPGRSRGLRDAEVGL